MKLVIVVLNSLLKVDLPRRLNCLIFATTIWTVQAASYHFNQVYNLLSSGVAQDF